jgi:hypothetical protein
MIDKLNDIGLVTTIIQMFIGGVLLFIQMCSKNVQFYSNVIKNKRDGKLSDRY